MTVLGLGDSISEGPGDSALGVLPRPWAHWLALALDAPFHGLALPGATTPEMAARLLPRAAGRRYGLACVHVGTNDVRLASWDPAVFEAALGGLLRAIDAERLCVATVPLDLGRPRAGAKVAELNAVVRRVAAGLAGQTPQSGTPSVCRDFPPEVGLGGQSPQSGVVVVELDDLRGWRYVMPDAVHPTALGQLAIADRAAAALGLDVRPSALADPHRSRRALARYAVTRHAPMLGRDVRRRVVERLTPR